MLHWAHNCPFVIEIMAVSDLKYWYAVDGMHEAPATIIARCPMPRRVVLLEFVNPVRRGDHFREHLHPHQRRESHQSHRRDAVRHCRHRNRHGSRRPRANN